MLPIVLVLLVATSALAAPRGVQVSYGSINDVAPPKNNGALVSSHWATRAFENVDGGDTNVYTLTAQQVIYDLANQSDRGSQALAVAQVIGLLGSLATGIPGDACDAANMIDSYVRGIRNGDDKSVRSAVYKFIQSLSSNIDLITKLVNNPESSRFLVGPRGNCNGGGRTYQFESAWDSILDNATPYSASLINEQYCAAKRLYSAFNSRSNNAGAILTAVSLPPVNAVFQTALEPVARFVAAISSGNPGSAAAAAKQALLHAAKY